MPRLLVLVLLLVTLALPACQSGGSGPPPTGWVQPTVAGRTAAVYAGLQPGREAFTRRSDSMTAVLEDASWLKFEGTPACVEANHRAYFEYGYTTFQVELRSREFTRPSQETFVLEDSTGLRAPGTPVSFRGAPQLVDDRYFSTFTLAFRHVISAELQWIRLTRPADGTWVEWRFGVPPAAPCDPCAPAR
jgi:hypothetical protein